MQHTTDKSLPLIANDAVVLGLLMLVLAGIFYTSSIKHGFWKKFYNYVPSLLLCYFIPSIFNSFGVIDGENSQLYFVASRYLLPTSLVLLTLSIDLKGVLRLGPKAVIMFLAGTTGIIIGGPIVIWIASMAFGDLGNFLIIESIWRGMTVVAGSWIGGAANQAAMKEVFEVDHMYAAMVAVDVIVANIWMAFLLYGARKSKALDKAFKADASAIEAVKQKIENYRLSIAKIPTLTNTMIILGLGFFVTALGHMGADCFVPWIEENAPFLEDFSLTKKFFWVVVIATTAGLLLSFTKARKLEGVGASRMGSAMLYILVATIGMHMDITAIFRNPGLFILGGIWMLVHVIILLLVGKLIRAPFFFTAVGSQANVGGAASAPIVASAFNPSLAPVGVLLAVLGYALGTYGAYICGLLMQLVTSY